MKQREIVMVNMFTKMVLANGLVDILMHEKGRETQLYFSR